MVNKPSARPYVPSEGGLEDLRKAVQQCHGCDLYKTATQAVFGKGSEHAKLFIIGEQPGDTEDIQGEPFVGAAGGVLKKALEEAKIPNEILYVTNAVKHFKWYRSGKKRIHQKPNMSEIKACRPWLDAEIEKVKPLLIICLGSTATVAVMGVNFRVLKDRGKPLDSPWGIKCFLTIHPSYVLRAPDENDREQIYQSLVTDLKVAFEFLKTIG